MSFIFEKPLTPTMAKPAAGVAGLGDIWNASIEQMKLVDNTNAAGEALTRAYDARIAAVKAATGQDLVNPMIGDDSDAIYQPIDPAARMALGAIDPNRADEARTRIARQRAAFDDKLSFLATQFPDKADAIRAAVPVADDATAMAREADEQLGALLASRPGWDSFASNLGGAVTGSLSDPLQVLSLFAGGGSGAGRTVFGRILSVATKEALVNGAVEAALQPMVQSWRKEAGLPNGMAEALKNVGFAAAGGAVLGGGLHAFGEGAAAMLRKPVVPPAVRDQVARAVADDPAVNLAMRDALKGDAKAAVDVLETIRPALPAEARGAIDAQRVAALDDAARVAADSQKPARVEMIDTRGGEARFHGSAAPISELQGFTYSSRNYYGQGFYTTDAVDIAKGYANRKGASSPSLYSVREKQPVRGFDMEAEVPDWLVAPEHADEGLDLVADALDELGKHGPFNTRELYDEVRELGSAEGLSSDGIQEIFDTLGYRIEEQGYGALDHTGGLRTGKAGHKVRIYLRPDEQIELQASNFKDFEAGNALATRAAEGDADALDQLAGSDPEFAPRVDSDAGYPDPGTDEFDLDDPFDMHQLDAQMRQFETWDETMLDMPAMDENGDMVPLRSLIEGSRRDDGLSRVLRACAL